MIVPMIHHWLRREDLARLVAHIATADPSAAGWASRALERGQVDDLLDLPSALQAIRGVNGVPAPVSLTLLWYVPVRAALRAQGEADIDLADFTATLPVVFHSARNIRRFNPGDQGLVPWARAIDALPRRTVVQAERAAALGALALWWSGCFPEAVIKNGGNGTLRAYADFAAGAFARAAEILRSQAPESAGLYEIVARRVLLIRSVLTDVKQDYLGPADDGLSRFLSTRFPRD